MEQQHQHDEEEKNNFSVVEGDGNGVGVGVGKSTFLQSTANVVGMTMGLGQLSTAYAVERGGWAGLGMLLCLGLVGGYTALLMAPCLRREAGAHSYQDLAQRSLGARGRLLVAAFLYTEIALSLVSYTISLADNLSIIFQGAHVHMHVLGRAVDVAMARVLTVAGVVAAMPSLWVRDLRAISCLSSSGFVMSMLLFFAVAWTAAFGGVGASRHVPALQVANLPAISGLYVFCFAGHAVFPNIYRSMRNPSHFPKVIAVSFTVISVEYMGLGLLGAAMYGSDVQSQITLNMSKKHAVSRMAQWATVITPLSKYALEVAPVAMQVEALLPDRMPKHVRAIARAAAGSLLLLIILVLALALPYFSYVLALTGCLLSASISIVFPCLFYMRICAQTMSRPALALNVFLVLLGLAIAFVGTVSSVQSLIHSVRDGDHTPST